MIIGDIRWLVMVVPGRVAHALRKLPLLHQLRASFRVIEAQDLLFALLQSSAIVVQFFDHRQVVIAQNPEHCQLPDVD